MGINRANHHKRRASGASRSTNRKSRKFEMGRQPANTRLGEKKIRLIRVRGGNTKNRALRLDHGNFSWGTESCTRKTRILDVVYNASSNELVRTKTLVKNAIIMIDAAPFRQWFEQRYAVNLSSKDKIEAALKKSHKIDPALAEQFPSGRILACISSRPGQDGTADGYILEGPELQFYAKKAQKKRSK